MGGNKEGEGSQQRLIPETGWQQEGLSHNELVDAFQRFIHEENTRYHGTRSPAEIIRFNLELEWQKWQSQPFIDGKRDKEKSQFFFQLLKAWDALAYDQYETGSAQENLAGVGLWRYYQQTRLVGDKPVIRLSQKQIQAIDALTEVVGIPHTKGQTEIEIPEKHRDRTKWLLSSEYQQRLAQAKAKRNT